MSEKVNVGQEPNDETGDENRVCWEKYNRLVDRVGVVEGAQPYSTAANTEELGTGTGDWRPSTPLIKNGRVISHITMQFGDNRHDINPSFATNRRLSLVLPWVSMAALSNRQPDNIWAFFVKDYTMPDGTAYQLRIYHRLVDHETIEFSFQSVHANQFTFGEYRDVVVHYHPQALGQADTSASDAQIEALQSAVDELNRVTGVGGEGNTAIDNLQQIDSAFLQKFTEHEQRLGVLEDISGAIADGRPGSPLVSYNPIGPKPRAKGSFGYDQFDLHDFGPGDDDGSRYQSRFNIAVDVGGWYTYTFKGYIFQPTPGEYTETIQLRERDSTWAKLEVPVPKFVSGTGSLPTPYEISGRAALEAGKNHTIVLAGSNTLYTSDGHLFMFSYDFEFEAQFVVPDPLHPGTWGNVNFYMVNTGHKTSKSDPVFRPETMRPNSSATNRVAIGRATQGQRYAVDIYNGPHVAEVIQVGIDTDQSGTSNHYETMAMRNVDNSPQWSFGDENNVTLIDDYWRVEFTANADGDVIVEIPTGNDGERREYAALRLEVL